MKIRILAVGRVREKYLLEALAEYQKRLRPFCKLEIIEVADEKAPETLSEKEVDLVKEKRGRGF